MPVNRTPPAVKPIGERSARLHYRVTSPIPVHTRWLSVEEVYAYAGATSESQKRTVRRHLAALHGHGVGKDRSGHWMAAEVIVRTAFARFHDVAIARQVADRARRDGGQFAAKAHDADVPRLRSAPGLVRRSA